MRVTGNQLNHVRFIDQTSKEIKTEQHKHTSFIYQNKLGASYIFKELPKDNFK
jgi:hypothetical protein